VLGFRTTAAACAVSVRERREMSKGRNAITWTMVGDVINLSWGECWRMRRERRSRDVGLEWRFVKDWEEGRWRIERRGGDLRMNEVNHQSCTVRIDIQRQTLISI